MTLRGRILVCLISVVAISGGTSTFIGGYLLQRHLGQEARNRVRQDLNTAHVFYEQRLAAMENALSYTALGEHFSLSVAQKDLTYLAPRLNKIYKSASLDVLLATDSTGHVIYRAHNPNLFGDSLAEDQLIGLVLKGEEVISGTLLVPIEKLKKEDPLLAERASIQIIATPKARPSNRIQLASGMMLFSAAAVHNSDGKLTGVLWSGTLLNQNYELVDQVRDTVFHEEQYRGRPLGTATVFQDDVRISTNVLREDNSRAIGSRVSAEVYEHVLEQGNAWVDRAWVVNDWYISAYEPIYDIDNKAVGMLYVGVLEGKFRDVTTRTFTIFGFITLTGLLIAAVVAWKLAHSISRPISSLASASSIIAQGDFSQTLPVGSADEIGSLTQSFNIMAQSLKERDERLKELTQLQLSRSEHLASIGRLAAGVAHEINNPLTGILTFAHMLRKNLPENSQDKKDTDTIIDATTRCSEIVKGLLNFSRQNEPQKKISSLNSVLDRALNLIKNQANISHINIIKYLDPALPQFLFDQNQIQDVAVNLIVNALDAMAEGGDLTVRTGIFDDNAEKWAQFEVTDTGCGIPPENLERIFDPFFTTKREDKGTGLGLAVSYGIVTKHDGQINISSQVNQGTAVTVRLPLKTEEKNNE
ncbi:cache domain-containing protein [Planctomycetota bacterium]